MKKILFAATALAMLTASVSYAADAEKMYLSNMGGKHMVMGGSNAMGTEVMMGEGAKPANCPAGDFYMTDSAQQMVMACDSDMKYSLMAPESGAMMADGKPYPEGSMMMGPAK
jgi:hypothetical protein